MKNLTTRRSVMLGLTLSLLMLASSITLAQSVKGRISFGIDAGGNKYYGNFTDNQFALHGDAFIRWNIQSYLSMHVAYNAGQLKWKQQAAPAIAGTNVMAEVGPSNELNHTRVGGWDLMFSYNVFPEETFVPYVIAGIEALNFEPKDPNDQALPNNRPDPSDPGNGIYAKNVFGGVMGVGFEMYISEKITFNGKGLLHLPGTDWIDDYSKPTDSRQDAFLTMGLGFSYYIFAPEIQPTVDYDRGGVTNITNVYNTSAPITVRVTDTVFKTRIIKGAVYDFPGTLFIVNSDEFNTAIPGNMQNLYNIKTLMSQCSDLRVEIAGHASHEGTVARNHELSHMRAERVKDWLIGQGVNPNKITGTPGLGTSDDAVHEPTNVSAEELERARVQNRRISVRVVEGCN